MKNPKDATLLESDGTFWKCEGNQYYWWREGWGWCQYAGTTSQSFYNKFRPVMLTDDK